MPGRLEALVVCETVSPHSLCLIVLVGIWP